MKTVNLDAVAAGIKRAIGAPPHSEAVATMNPFSDEFITVTLEDGTLCNWSLIKIQEEVLKGPKPYIGIAARDWDIIQLTLRTEELKEEYCHDNPE